MVESHNNRWAGPAIIAGAVGFAVWKSLSPGSREKVWRFVEAMAEEHERRKVAELAQAEQLLIPSLEDLNFGSYPLDISPRPVEPVVEASPGETRFQAAAAKLELPDPGDRIPEDPVSIDRDRKWMVLSELRARQVIRST